MLSISHIAWTAAKLLCITLALFLTWTAVWLFNMLVIAPLFDPLMKLPGPKAPALTSHLMQLMNPQNSPKTHDNWIAEYGKTFRYHGFGKHDLRLISLDFRVLSHVLKSPIYEKPWQTRVYLSKLVGEGIFSMERDDHKFQRKLIGPAFTAQSLKSIAPILFKKAGELLERWESIVPPSPAAASVPSNPEPNTIDVAHWMSRACFDVIGLTGFDYDFHSLRDETEPVYLAYRTMFENVDRPPDIFGVLRIYYPFLDRLFPDEYVRSSDASMALIRKAGEKLISEKKARLLAQIDDAGDIQEKDLLSLLIKANLSTDTAKRLSDSVLLDQCSVFLLGGSDSVSLAITWCLHFLSLDLNIQTRLREELLSLPTTSFASAANLQQPIHNDTLGTSSEKSSAQPTDPPLVSDYTSQAHWEAIETLPFLDCVVRETLRLCPPVHGTLRVATADDLIPISEPMILQDGSKLQSGDTFRIRKGTFVHIPIEGVNMCRDLYGDDAHKFNPSRWTELPSKAKAPKHPGLSNLMTFSLGPHSCLGNKISMAEMKVFLATLLPHFVFKPVPGATIVKSNAVLTRPYVNEKWEQGTQLPLIVERVVEG